jgi:hypothetical protein
VAQRIDLEVDAGSMLAEPFNWTEEDGTPVLEGAWPAGWTARFVAAATPGVLLLELTDAVTTEGAVLLEDDARLTLTITAEGVDALAARWAWWELYVQGPPPDELEPLVRPDPERLAEGLIRRVPTIAPAV